MPFNNKKIMKEILMKNILLSRKWRSLCREIPPTRRRQQQHGGALCVCDSFDLFSLSLFFFWQNVEDDVSTEMEDYVNDNPVIEVDDSGVPVCPPVVLIINLNFQK